MIGRSPSETPEITQTLGPIRGNLINPILLEMRTFGASSRSMITHRLLLGNHEQTNVNRRRDRGGLRVLRTHPCSCRTRLYLDRSTTFSPRPGGITALRPATFTRKCLSFQQDSVCSGRTSNPSLILIISRRRFSKSGIREMQQLFQVSQRPSEE